MISGIIQYRSFIWRQAVSDLRHRYAGTGLGLVWNVLHPLALIALYSMVFSHIMPIRLAATVTGPWSYILYLCSGFFPWMAFSDCVGRGCNAFWANTNYLKKLPIPEQVFVAQTAMGTALSLAINFGLVMVVGCLVGLPANWRWALLPIPLVLMMLLAFALGLLLGTLNVFFRDIGELTGVTLQVIMWTAPIVYSKEGLPRWVLEVMKWHPFVPSLDAIRDLFLDGRMPPPGVWILMAAWPAAALVLSYAVLRSLRHEIRDVI